MRDPQGNAGVNGPHRESGDCRENLQNASECTQAATKSIVDQKKRVTDLRLWVWRGNVHKSVDREGASW